MTRPLFLAALPDPLPGVGAGFRLDGTEGRHASVVRRIQVGEEITVADGAGQAVIAETVAADKQGLELRVVGHQATDRSPMRVVAVQALAKGDRSELAIEMLTEVGVDEIWPWQSARSIVKWSGERGEKSLQKWRATVREATKQSRRAWIPEVSAPVTTKNLVARLAAVDLALVLHEDAVDSLASVELPTTGTVAVIVGPEGGIGDDELTALRAAGARPVVISDGVLRTSTAGPIAVGHLRLVV